MEFVLEVVLLIFTAYFGRNKFFNLKVVDPREDGRVEGIRVVVFSLHPSNQMTVAVKLLNKQGCIPVGCVLPAY